jgi:hypothetical protein
LKKVAKVKQKGKNILQEKLFLEILKILPKSIFWGKKILGPS